MGVFSNLTGGGLSEGGFKPGPFTYFSLAKLGLKALGVDIPGITSFGARGSAEIEHTGIDFGQTDNPVLQSYYLDFPDMAVQGRRRGQDVYDIRQKPIDFAIDETRDRLTSLGMTAELNEFNSVVDKISGSDRGANESIPLQKVFLTAIAEAEGLISTAFDEAEANGIDPNMRAEFNRQTQERAFNFNQQSLKDITKNKRERDIFETQQGATDIPSLFPSKEGVSTNRDAAEALRLKPFANQFFPNLEVEAGFKPSEAQPLQPDDRFRLVNGVKVPFKGDSPLVVQKDNARTFRQSDTDRLFDNPTGVQELNIPIADITNFLTSFNPQQPPTGPGGEGNELDPQEPTDDPNTNIDLNIPGTDIPGSVDGSGGNEQPPDDDIDLDIPIPPVIIGGDTGGGTDVPGGNTGGGGTPDINLDIPLPVGSFNGGSVGGGSSITPVQQIPIKPTGIIDTRRNLVQPEIHKFTPKGFPLVSRGILQGRAV